MVHLTVYVCILQRYAALGENDPCMTCEHLEYQQQLCYRTSAALCDLSRMPNPSEISLPATDLALVRRRLSRE